MITGVAAAARVVSPAVACALWLILAPSAVPAADEKRQPELVVLARLSHRGDAIPDCGILHLAVVMKYQITKVLSGAHEESTLYVVHGCPALPRKDYAAEAGDVVRFQVGDVHRLSLTTRGPFLNGEAIDAFSSERGRRYWALRTDTVPAEKAPR